MDGLSVAVSCLDQPDSQRCMHAFLECVCFCVLLGLHAISILEKGGGTPTLAQLDHQINRLKLLKDFYFWIG